MMAVLNQGQRSTVKLFVPGVPIPQGSMKAFVVKNRAIITSDNTKLKPWRNAIAIELVKTIGLQIKYPTGPIQLGLWFVMPRRASEPKRVTPPHTRKPDLDKLIRAVCDALTGHAYTDDSQVISITTTKTTAAMDETPGVKIMIEGVG